MAKNSKIEKTDDLKVLKMELQLNQMLPGEMQVPEHIATLKSRIAVLERCRGLKVIDGKHAEVR